MEFIPSSKMKYSKSGSFTKYCISVVDSMLFASQIRL